MEAHDTCSMRHALRRARLSLTLHSYLGRLNQGSLLETYYGLHTVVHNLPQVLSKGSLQTACHSWER